MKRSEKFGYSLLYYDKIYFNDYEKLCKRSPYIAKSIKKQTKESTKK